MTTPEIAPAVSIKEVITAEPAPAKAVAIVPTPATWFIGLSVAAKNKIRFVAVEHLKLHPTCDFLPLSPHAYDIILKSVEQNGVLYPLAVAADGRVIDGRYRLRAAQELSLTMLPVLSIDIKGDSVVDWIFHINDDREHLTEGDRLVLAHQYQHRLSGDYKKIRATKMTTARLTKTKATAKRHSAKPKSEPKKDSRKEAARKFDVPTRKLNAVNILAKEKPDLYAKVATGEMKIEAALKQRGKNIEKSRVIAALQVDVRPEDVSDDEMENRIHCGEAQDVLTKIADATASLVLFSPPYYGANVDYDPALRDMNYQQYLDQLKTVMEESFRVSRSGGRLMMVVDTTHNPVPGGDEMLPIFADLTVIARQIGWKYWMDFAWLKPEICGSKTTFGSLGKCSAPGWGRDHEWILLFFKDLKKLEGDVALSDLSSDDHQQWWDSTWEIRAETRREILAAHPAAFPEELVERAIKLLTYRRDLVIDPYNGSGTTTTVAKRLGRRYIGVDRSPKYCRAALQRGNAGTLADLDGTSATAPVESTRDLQAA